jgi:glycosyltransferase involved in cell wall biosynthesis
MLNQITPIILTFNEAPNIGRTLEQLRWARDVLVVDSFSTDETLSIVRSFPNTRVQQHAFVDFASQWHFALEYGAITTPWVLALDADYVLTSEFVEELAQLAPTADVLGYRTRFRYCVDGELLRGSLYPPSVVLYRRVGARYRQDGHCYRLEIDPARVQPLQAFVLHDDRKPFSRWLASQRRYAAEEAIKLQRGSFAEFGWPDRVRRVPFTAAPLVFLHCMIIKRCALDGRAGAIYTAQRVIAESMISLAFLARILRR